MCHKLSKNSCQFCTSPLQLGLDVPKGAEAVTHATRIYVQNLTPDSALLKLDFSNPFNSLHRDMMFLAVRDLALQLFSFVISTYMSPSTCSSEIG